MSVESHVDQLADADIGMGSQVRNTTGRVGTVIMFEFYVYELEELPAPLIWVRWDDETEEDSLLALGDVVSLTPGEY